MENRSFPSACEDCGFPNPAYTPPPPRPRPAWPTQPPSSKLVRTSSAEAAKSAAAAERQQRAVLEGAAEQETAAAAAMEVRHLRRVPTAAQLQAWPYCRRRSPLSDHCTAPPGRAQGGQVRGVFCKGRRLTRRRRENDPRFPMTSSDSVHAPNAGCVVVIWRKFHLGFGAIGGLCGEVDGGL